MASAQGRRLSDLDPEAFSDLAIPFGGLGPLDSNLDPLRDLDANDLDVAPDAPEERRDLLRRADGRGQADPLELMADEVPEALEADRQLGPSLIRGELVNLVDDDPTNAPKVFPQLASREQNLERLRGRDEDIRRTPSDRGPLLGGRVAVADRDAHVESVREERHATEHVSVQRAQRRDVQARRWLGLVVQDAVEDGQDRGLGLPDPGRRDQQHVGPRQDPRDRALLRFRERLDPEGGDGLEQAGVEPQAVHAALEGPLGLKVARRVDESRPERREKLSGWITAPQGSKHRSTDGLLRFQSEPSPAHLTPSSNPPPADPWRVPGAAPRDPGGRVRRAGIRVEPGHRGHQQPGRLFGGERRTIVRRYGYLSIAEPDLAAEEYGRHDGRAERRDSVRRGRGAFEHGPRHRSDRDRQHGPRQLQHPVHGPTDRRESHAVLDRRDVRESPRQPLRMAPQRRGRLPGPPGEK